MFVKRLVISWCGFWCSCCNVILGETTAHIQPTPPWSCPCKCTEPRIPDELTQAVRLVTFRKDKFGITFVSTVNGALKKNSVYHSSSMPHRPSEWNEKTRRIYKQSASSSAFFNFHLFFHWKTIPSNFLFCSMLYYPHNIKVNPLSLPQWGKIFLCWISICVCFHSNCYFSCPGLGRTQRSLWLIIKRPLVLATSCRLDFSTGEQTEH